MTTVKDAARSVGEAERDRLVGLSHAIWDRPELGFEEHEASARCAEALDRAGFRIDHGVAGLETAFVAEFGSGPLVVGVCAEYDALPEIGHACGHNVIASAAVGAGLALAQVADDIGITVRVLGTPAEEGGGGKITMVEAGSFDGVHLAMMVHPAPMESDVFPTLASTSCEYHFHGRTAHASMAPEEGINAADAITIGQVGVGLLRQHLQPGDQVHGIVTRGGEAPNVVPGHAVAKYIARAPSLEALHRLTPRIDRCFEAGALATGARLEMVRDAAPYSEFVHDGEVAARYRANAEALGRVFGPPSTEPAASTDMANISLLMPTIHPSLGYDCAPVVNHQPEFAAVCRTEEADRSVVDGAVAMAWTAIDAATDDALRERLTGADTTYGGREFYPWTAPE